MDSTSQTNQLLLTAKATARALAISERKLWGMTASGEIPHVRISRSVRYTVADLQRWIEAHTFGGNSHA